MKDYPIDINSQIIPSTNDNSQNNKCIDDIISEGNITKVNENENLTQVLSRVFLKSNEESQNQEDKVPDNIYFIDKNLKNVPNIRDSNKNTNQKKIFFSTYKFLNKKKKHDKYSEDNESKKIKRIIKDALIDFINYKIKKSKFHFNIEDKDCKLLNIKPQQILDNKIDSTLELFKTKIKDFLSVTISDKYINYPENFNELVIQKLYKDESFKKILDQTFLDCMKYCIKNKDVNDKPDSCLNGLEIEFKKQMDKLKKKYEKEYVKEIIDLMNNYAKIDIQKELKKKKVDI